MSARNFTGVVGGIGKAYHRSIVQTRALQRYLARVKLKVDKIL